MTIRRESAPVPLVVEVDPQPLTGTAGLRYDATASGGVWAESLTLADATLFYDPVETARALRSFAQLPTPQWERNPTQPLDVPLLWGFMPLKDGWAQLPIANLTEQIYLDAKLVPEPASALPAKPAFDGVIRKLKDAKVWPADTSDDALIWRRHAQLPIIQALPMTQSQQPPNHPSASRQLAPFAVTNGASLGWSFGADAQGAARFPSLKSDAVPDPQWAAKADLPMASLWSVSQPFRCRTGPSLPLRLALFGRSECLRRSAPREFGCLVASVRCGAHHSAPPWIATRFTRIGNGSPTVPAWPPAMPSKPFPSPILPKRSANSLSRSRGSRRRS